MSKRKIKKPSEFAKDTWVFNGTTYYQVNWPDKAEDGRYSAIAIEEGAKPNVNKEYRCVEIFLTSANGQFNGIEEVKRSSFRWDAVNGGFAGDFDELLGDLTFDQFSDIVCGCDCTEARVSGNVDIGGDYFTFDCDMQGPNGRVCVSGVMTKDEDDLITGVEDITIRDFSQMEDGGMFEDAPIIDDPDEIGVILEKLSHRFMLDEDIEDDEVGGIWSL